MLFEGFLFWEYFNIAGDGKSFYSHMSSVVTILLSLLNIFYFQSKTIFIFMDYWPLKEVKGRDVILRISDWLSKLFMDKSNQSQIIIKASTSYVSSSISEIDL